IAGQIVLMLWKSKLGTMQGMEPITDPKTRLQEIAQAGNTSLPVYTLVTKTGPAHAAAMTIECKYGVARTFGHGSTKRQAEINAAQSMLEWLLTESRSLDQGGS